MGEPRRRGSPTALRIVAPQRTGALHSGSRRNADIACCVQRCLGTSNGRVASLRCSGAPCVRGGDNSEAMTSWPCVRMSRASGDARLVPVLAAELRRPVRVRGSSIVTLAGGPRERGLPHSRHRPTNDDMRRWTMKSQSVTNGEQDGPASGDVSARRLRSPSAGSLPGV